ncbi:hypothetical protein QTQ03_26580 [Micromonospora sp. WMMA1363]|uniref:hypothetical protein n=1 Tax=Micromonospora sp. WMMA1363 TaxID=3053985 RepID=UPI00259CB10F|nr:hypothetical protein [Micromonospora sp. WMMA1363]MDM4720135.1 hypothetical protein [Micromonospora sp. WMMA1363]MDM4722995.1 hypothetical protein [Micromonospora sp. WMMA1363]
MGVFVDRLVKRTVLICAVLAALAAYSNHTTHPCRPDQSGAAGMCVSTGSTR